MPDHIDDPLEPVNRGMWAINRGLLEAVISPVSRGYRAVVPGRVRESIRDFGYNVAYPGRALNQLLQGRVGDAGDESLRFLCNTTAGVLGFFDVATKWEIPKHDADFAQTFQRWGWDGKNYLMLPVLGPSDELHAVGFGMDRLAYPLTYDSDARMVGKGITFNQMAEGADEAVRRMRSDPDPYTTVRYLWTYASIEEEPDWSLHGPRDISTLQTLAVATLRLKNPAFLDKMIEDKVKLPTTGRKMPFNFWLQKEKAPLVYIAPGLGSHRLSMQALAVAESLYDNGFSVVTTAGLFHPEFIQCVSSSKVPGYSHADRQDLLVALSEIDRVLDYHYGHRLGSRALVGCSMGGFQTLAIADQLDGQGADKVSAATLANGHRLRIQRYIAVNPPVDLHHGLAVLDAFHDAPLDWPEEVRQQRINNSIHKVTAMARSKGAFDGPPPFDGVESKYLIGATFRLTLRSAIYTSQKLNNLGVLKQPLGSWDRAATYDEIVRISFQDYFERFVQPYHEKRDRMPGGFVEDGNLRHLAPGLKRLDKAHVITSRNDFLLSNSDIRWLQSTFGPKRLVLLEEGGHLGALADPGFHKQLVEMLQGL